jgi:hypothetical protein
MKLESAVLPTIVQGKALVLSHLIINYRHDTVPSSVGSSDIAKITVTGTGMGGVSTTLLSAHALSSAGTAEGDFAKTIKLGVTPMLDVKYTIDNSEHLLDLDSVYLVTKMGMMVRV